LTRTAVLIPGDGIGPEVAECAVSVLDAAGAGIEWLERQAGVAALESGEPEVLPESTLEAIIECGVALKGPCTTPIGEGFASVNVQLRKRLDLYAAVRPVRTLPGVPGRYEDVDLIIVRENTEGLYSGIENVVTEGVVTSLKVATEKACRRVARFAFAYAASRGRHKVTVLHKANIMKLTDGLFLRCAREEFEKSPPGLEYEEVIIDAGCMRIVQDPSQFDVLLCENLYGDVVSDLCAGLVGGLGVTPGANIGEERAVFEAVHGSAPTLAGLNQANPLALLMSGVMMLNYISDQRGVPELRDCGSRIRAAYNATLESGARTRDLGGQLGTREFGDAVITRL
jgi:isocitrate dehydrogenase (NAD+)